MGKLTGIQINNWIRAGLPVAKADGDGLTFTLSVKGTAAWVLRYRFGGKGRELTIGRYPDISLARARELATEARARIQQGEDVGREKQREKIEQAGLKLFRELAEDYMAKKFSRLAETTAKQRRYHIKKLILPRLGNIPAGEVSAANIVSLLEAIGKKSYSVAELVLTAISEIFKHGIGRHAVAANPCVGIVLSSVLDRPETRQRLNLSEEELRTILPTLSLVGEENALAVKIQLATCVRLGELVKARWADVDLERGEWVVREENSKTRSEYTVPLPPVVAEWFDRLKVLACGSPYVLPARQPRRMKKGEDGMHCEQRGINAAIHRLCDKLEGKVRRFTPHDLRSTARSHLGSMGVPVVVAERCLNHSLGGLLKIYDQHDYMTERRAALMMWCDFIVACETKKEWKKGGDVIQFRAA